MPTATLCLILGAKTVSLPTDHFTLAWTHSIEKIEWQEDYVLENTRLILTEARIQGTGAGMEPPPDARFEGGWWHYRPNLPPLPQLRLTLSTYTADYRLCWDGRCQPLRSLFGAQAPDGVVTVEACDFDRGAAKHDKVTLTRRAAALCGAFGIDYSAFMHRPFPTAGTLHAHP